MLKALYYILSFRIISICYITIEGKSSYNIMLKDFNN